MKTLGAALFTFLDSQSTITAFVGGSSATPPSTPRIYPINLQQGGALPALRYSVVIAESQIAHDGPVGTSRTRMQISVFTKSFTAGEPIVDALRQALAGYIGLWGDVNVKVTEFNAGADSYEELDKIFHSPVQFVVFHDESTPTKP